MGANFLSWLLSMFIRMGGFKLLEAVLRRLIEKWLESPKVDVQSPTASTVLKAGAAVQAKMLGK